DWSIEAGNYAKLHWITAHGEHDRNRVGGRLGSKRWCDTNHDDHANLAADEIDCERRKVPVLVLRPAIFNRHVLPLNIADFRETPPNGLQAVGSTFKRSWGKESDHRHRRLLRLRPERPRRRSAAECGQHFPPSDGDCHTPLPCEVRKGNETISRRERAVFTFKEGRMLVA